MPPATTAVRAVTDANAASEQPLAETRAAYEVASDACGRSFADEKDGSARALALVTAEKERSIAEANFAFENRLRAGMAATEERITHSGSQAIAASCGAAKPDASEQARDTELANRIAVEEAIRATQARMADFYRAALATALAEQAMMHAAQLTANEEAFAEEREQYRKAMEKVVACAKEAQEAAVSRAANTAALAAEEATIVRLSNEHEKVVAKLMKERTSFNQRMEVRMSHANNDLKVILSKILGLV